MSKGSMPSDEKLRDATKALFTIRDKFRASYGAEWPAVVKEFGTVLQEYASTHNVDPMRAAFSISLMPDYASKTDMNMLLLSVALEITDPAAKASQPGIPNSTH